MRSYRIQVDQRNYNSTVQQSSEKLFEVKVDGRSYQLRQHRTEEIVTWSVTSPENSGIARTRTGAEGHIIAWVAGLPFDVTLRQAGTAGYLLPLVSASTAASEIRAVMPGRITSIIVKEGDTVEFGTPLLVLEAMKMQNEISSPTRGRVKRVRVSEGELVKKDSLLVEVEASSG